MVIIEIPVGACAVSIEVMQINLKRAWPLAPAILSGKMYVHARAVPRRSKIIRGLENSRWSRAAVLYKQEPAFHFTTFQLILCDEVGG